MPQRAKTRARTGRSITETKDNSQRYRPFSSSRAGRCYCRVGVRSHTVHRPLIKCSIVLVHGLGGHPRRTWACAKPTQLAPQVPRRPAGHSHLLKKLFSRKQKTDLDDAHNSGIEAVYWPLDFLADDFVNSRILTWGYDSNISKFFGGAASQSNIRGHAQNLLRALMVKRLNSVRCSAIVSCYRLLTL